MSSDFDSSRAAGLLRGLLYPVLFERVPEDGIARVLELVVDRQPAVATRAEYAAAIRAALESNEALVELIPQPIHSEDVVRRYLLAMNRALAADPDDDGRQP